jgi:hypothetical protein
MEVKKGCLQSEKPSPPTTKKKKTKPIEKEKEN